MLDEMHRTISMAAVVKDPKAVFDAIETSREFYRIRRPGHRTMILVDEEELDGYIAALEFMSRPNWREQLEQSERDVAEGRTYSLDEVLGDLGLERTANGIRKKPSRKPAATRSRKARAGVRSSRGRSARRSRLR